MESMAASISEDSAADGSVMTVESAEDTLDECAS